MRKQQRTRRNWTKSEYADIVNMKQSQKLGWTDIAQKVNDTVENTIAAYRRAVGAKHGAYKNAAYSNEPAMHTTLENPKIAVLDIETLPGVGFFWQLFDTTISIDQVIEDITFLSWAGKWLDSPKMYSDILTPDEAIHRDTSRITQSVWDFLKQADIVVGHNFHGYDSKIINTNYLEHGLGPLKPVIIDTLLVAKNHFRFSSNKLQFINRKLGMRDKMDTGGFQLWKDCHYGDPVALQKMKDYNIQDIYSTEDLMMRFRPYIKNLNVALYVDSVTEICPVCGSKEWEPEGSFFTPAGRWPARRCQNCLCLYRTKVNLFDKYKKRSLGINS